MVRFALDREAQCFQVLQNPGSPNPLTRLGLNGNESAPRRFVLQKYARRGMTLAIRLVIP